MFHKHSHSGTLGLVRILPMIGPRNAAMTAALLAVRIQVADFYGLAAPFLPFNLHIDVVHIDLISQPVSKQFLDKYDF